MKSFFRARVSGAFRLSAAGWLFCFLCCARAFGAEIKDATDVIVHVAKEPVRIVTLMPSLGEIAADILEGKLDRIVGVSEMTDYPPALRKARSVGPYHRLNLELIASLKPDLILATKDGNMKDQVLHLRELGFPVVVIRTETMKDVGDSVRLISKAMGAPARGEVLAAKLEEGIAKVRERARKIPPESRKRVLLQLGSDPLIVVGRKSFLHEALVTVGARNLYEDSQAIYPRPSLEDVVQRNPDLILVLSLGEDAGTFAKMARQWERFSRINAVRMRAVHVLRADELLRPSLRLLDGLDILAKAVYP